MACAAQRTLQDSVRYSGIALHTGVRAHLTLYPAAADTGIVIERVDLPGKPRLRAHVSEVSEVRRATTLGQGPARTHTVEHVLATLYALGIDNALLAMDGPEPPVADGSARAYLEAIDAVGTVAQEAPRRELVVTAPLYYQQGATLMVVLPADEYRISCTIQFGLSAMDCQYLDLTVSEESFRRDVAGARTFCAYHEIEPLMVAGLIRGGSLDNSVVMKDQAIISKEGLRWPDEFVRHKILDMIGDLSLVGRRLRAHVIAIKPGHAANVALAGRILSYRENEDE